MIEAIEYEQQVPRELRRRIEVDTYHSFFWRILKAHGYLVGLPRRLSILTPTAEAIALSAIRNGCAAEAKLSAAKKFEKNGREQAERLRLAREDGRAWFDLFARCVSDIRLAAAKLQLGGAMLLRREAWRCDAR